MTDTDKKEETNVEKQDEKKSEEKASADTVILKHSSDGASSLNSRIGGELGKFLYQRPGTYFDINAGKADHALFEAVEIMLKGM